MSSRTLCAIGHYAGLLSRDERKWSACGPNDADDPMCVWRSWHQMLRNSSGGSRWKRRTGVPFPPPN